MELIYARALRCDFDLRDGLRRRATPAVERGSAERVCAPDGFLLSMIASDGAMNQPE